MDNTVVIESDPEQTQRQYFVQYGLSSYVGCFGARDHYSRGEEVVIQSPRGLEFAKILCEVDARHVGNHTRSLEGTILRKSAPTAPQQLTSSQMSELLSEGNRLIQIAGESAAFLDVEQLCDGTIILHVAAWSAADLTPIAETLAHTFRCSLRLETYTSGVEHEHQETESGCGESGCGSGNCSGDSCQTSGCSTGGCSRGQVKSADELRDHFRQLRESMEQDSKTRVELN